MSQMALRLIEENKKTKAKVLDLGKCSAETIPEEIGDCVWLEELYLSDQVYDRLIGMWIKSKNNGHKNHIESLPKTIANLKNLKVLVMAGDYEDHWPINDLAPLSNLANLKRLDCQRTNVFDLSPIADLINLEQLFIHNTSVSTLSPLISLKNIERLDCTGTLVSDISPILHLIKNGIKIGRSHINRYILLDDCPIVNPPKEIINQGNNAVIRYFEEKNKQGTQYLYEAKIIIIGAGGSGKTTLIKKLLNHAHPVPNLDDKRTEGIHVTNYLFSQKIFDKINNLTAHLWDFGGQELYYTTHQLFLTPDTLYILLNDNRQNDTDFYYWLNIVTLRAGEKCPILMVFNAKENAPRQIVLGEDLFKAFRNLIPEPIEINFANRDPKPILQMKNLIESHFSELEVLGKLFPTYWVKVRKILGQIPEEHISWSKFETICRELGVEDLPQMRIIAQTLHNLGALLYFQNVFGLEDLVILKPQWCIDAIYLALDIPEIQENAGRFNKLSLAAKWSSERFAGNRLQLLGLMQHFDLCYAVEGTNNYIAPQLLPLEERRYPDFPVKGVITYRFDYTFMPAGLLTRLIARLSRHIKAPYVWRTGVTLEWEDGTIAEVIENHFSRQIVMRVSGADRKRRLSDIRKTLHDLHQMFRGLKFEELVACNCPDCTNSYNATTFELKSLEDDALHNDEVKCTNVMRKKIPARQILDGIEYVDKPRIFVSYSHKNEAFKEEFRMMIRPFEREGHWKVWDDRWLLPGDNWNQEIMRQLSEANIIVLLLTPDFFNSDYIYDIEMSRAIQRHESGDALVVGVVVSDCLWEETPLRKIQMVPKDGLPVERHPHRNEVWKMVANKMKEAIAVREGRQSRRGGWEVND